MRQQIRRWRLHLHTAWTLDALARKINPVIRGWINYYGRYRPTGLTPTLHSIDKYLVRWLIKNTNGSSTTTAGPTGSCTPANSVSRICSRTGAAWCPRLDDGSRMNREVHVRFCESREVQLLPATHPVRERLSRRTDEVPRSECADRRSG